MQLKREQRSKSPPSSVGLAPSDRLRPHQRRERRDLERLLEKHRSVLLQAHMGSGKTVVAAAMVRQWVAQGSGVLYLVHRGEILKQAAKHLQEAGVPATSIGYLWPHGAMMVSHSLITNQWRAEIPTLLGCLAYGPTRDLAIQEASFLAMLLVMDRMQRLQVAAPPRYSFGTTR